MGDLTAESTNLEVLMLWSPFEAVKPHVPVLCRLCFRLIRFYIVNSHALSGGGVFDFIVLQQTSQQMVSMALDFRGEITHLLVEVICL